MLVSLLSHSLSVGSGGGQTPQWAWALRRDSLSVVQCHLSLPSYVVRTPSSFFYLYIVPPIVPLSSFIFISIFAAHLSLLTFLSVFEAISFSFVSPFPTHPLSSPSLPPSPPGWLCLDHVEHSRLLNIHHSGTSCKQNRPPSWTAST